MFFREEVRETYIFEHLCLSMLLGELSHLWLIWESGRKMRVICDHRIIPEREHEPRLVSWNILFAMTAKGSLHLWVRAGNQGKKKEGKKIWSSKNVMSRCRNIYLAKIQWRLIVVTNLLKKSNKMFCYHKTVMIMVLVWSYSLSTSFCSTSRGFDSNSHTYTSSCAGRWFDFMDYLPTKHLTNNLLDLYLSQWDDPMVREGFACYT